jgi:hypothetical protein
MGVDLSRGIRLPALSRKEVFNISQPLLDDDNLTFKSDGKLSLSLEVAEPLTSLEGVPQSYGTCILR